MVSDEYSRRGVGKGKVNDSRSCKWWRIESGARGVGEISCRITLKYYNNDKRAVYYARVCGNVW